MSIDYPLFFADKREPAEILEWLVSQPEPGLSWNIEDHSFLRGVGVDIDVNICLKRPDRKSLIEQLHGWEDNFCVTFQLSKTREVVDGKVQVSMDIRKGHRTIINVTLNLFQFVTRQAILYYESDYVLLEKTSEFLILNKKWEGWFDNEDLLEKSGLVYEFREVDKNGLFVLK